MTLQAFAPMTAMVIVAIIVGFIILWISRVFGPHNPTFRKNAPYESGMKPIGPANRRLPVKFYLVAVLFIVFDVEVIFFLPWAVALRDFRAVRLVGHGIFHANTCCWLHL